MSNSDIAARAGIARSTVDKLSKLNQWDSIPMGTAESFARGCGVNLLRPGEHFEFIRRRGLRYMKLATPSQRMMYGRLIAALKGSRHDAAVRTANTRKVSRAEP